MQKLSKELRKRGGVDFKEVENAGGEKGGGGGGGVYYMEYGMDRVHSH